VLQAPLHADVLHPLLLQADECCSGLQLHTPNTASCPMDCNPVTVAWKQVAMYEHKSGAMLTVAQQLVWEFVATKVNMQPERHLSSSRTTYRWHISMQW